MKRRNFISGATLAAAGLASKSTISQERAKDFQLKNNINHSVCQWCFSSYPLEEFLAILNDLGIKAIDLIGPKDFDLLRKYDMLCSMCNGAEISLTEGFNDPKYHDQLIKNYTEVIPKVADAGFKNLICFSGNRRGMDDYVGLDNCVMGLEKIVPIAEKYGVIIQMEL